MKDAIYGRIWKLRITHKDCTNLIVDILYHESIEKKEGEIDHLIIFIILLMNLITFSLIF